MSDSRFSSQDWFTKITVTVVVGAAVIVALLLLVILIGWLVNVAQAVWS